MALLLSGGLEASQYWQKVRGEADGMLKGSPLVEWTINLRPKTTNEGQVMEPDPGQDAREFWYVSTDADARELTVGVPPYAIDTEDGEPKQCAAYLVFDLLDEVVLPPEDDDSDD